MRKHIAAKATICQAFYTADCFPPNTHNLQHKTVIFERSCHPESASRRMKALEILRFTQNDNPGQDDREGSE
jgi:hypothetical protein